jgi:Spy/CpxP family protein refolding chaperone
MKKLWVIGMILIAAAVYAVDDDPRAIIENVRIYRMTKELDLSSEQAIELFPKLKELQKAEQQFTEEKTRILNGLRDRISRGSTDQEILSLLDEFENAHRRRLENLVARTKDMFEILTPTQRAKFLIFQDDFNREIRELIKKVKQHKKLNP